VVLTSLALQQQSGLVGAAVKRCSRTAWPPELLAGGASGHGHFLMIMPRPLRINRQTGVLNRSFDRLL
jgi:hypothetical protein